MDLYLKCAAQGLSHKDVASQELVNNSPMAAMANSTDPAKKPMVGGQKCKGYVPVWPDNTETSRGPVKVSPLHSARTSQFSLVPFTSGTCMAPQQMNPGIDQVHTWLCTPLVLQPQPA